MAPSIIVWAEDKNPDPLLNLLQRVFVHTVKLQSWKRTASTEKLRSGNGWRSHADHDLRVGLIKQLADQLAKPDGVVLFHYDGDKTWANRRHAEIPPDFNSKIRTKVIDRLASTKVGSDAHKRLIEIVPYYSLEAWLYQATDRAKELCTERHASRHHNFWQELALDRALIDEREKPKINDCIGDTANLDLAARFPAFEALGVQKSFFAAAISIARCEVLQPLIRPDLVALLNAAKS